MRLKLSPDAVQDRRRVLGFLKEVNPNAARRASQIIIRAVAQLAHSPHIGLARDGLRELYVPFGESGYVIQYRVDADAVVIARIFHAREER